MKIYVGNLPYGIGEDDIRKVFEPFGEVGEINIIIDRMSGRSKGFGFVEMSNDDEAQKAISELNGTDLGGRQLNVNKARPRVDRGGGGGGGRRY
ncbi:MAG: RNA-binding protein [Candidatus Zixiibacteriota bacterium]|nr:MAG: RNA-binding protein [candidate division Zixibacteria bacterium]HHI03119.1 RNA-binding protein [candidate division Zixibacteria bacterium]